RRALAAQQPAGEVGREVHHELHVAAGERFTRRLLALQLGDEIEIAARLHRREVAARELALFGDDHRGRKMLRVGVDGVAEENELDDRHADDHAERDAVAPQLQELLQHDPPPAREREPPHCLAPKLSSERLMRWMNTSSSPLSARSTRQAVPAVARRSDASSTAASRPVTWSAEPKAAICSTPGSPCSFAATAARSSPDTDHVDRRAAAMISS